MSVIFYGAKMSAIEGEGLNAAVTAVGDQQHWLAAARVNPQAVRGIELSISVTGAANFTEKFSVQRKAQNVMRTVAIADIKIAVRRKGHVSRDKIDGPFGVS